ncbi:hypothetical protein BVG79_00901 [Ketogulonicigenium robustum]|uniref:Uncharacterized protein n=1 Tax=Ketogulonicigenium robustum TaxID=92947 RepID=A0A1W6NYM3_9RHOB|nr:pore-forming ESAT-6 family protein [Ketogulonicigenium robustum]ARO14253.1 hypothetical protein BVG79_00901 [Ketogulonicigenium robustum]
MFNIRTAVVAAVACMGATAAFAQAPAMPTQDDMIAASKNQLGILEYCQGKGFVEQDVVDIQNRLMAALPPSETPDVAEAAYQQGLEGKVSAMGTEVSIADAATAQGTTEEAFCGQISDLVKQLGASLPAQ